MHKEPTIEMQQAFLKHYAHPVNHTEDRINEYAEQREAFYKGWLADKKETTTLRNTLEIVTEAEQRAVDRYVPIMKENERLQAENATLKERNRQLEHVHTGMVDAANVLLSLSNVGSK